jgi:glutamate 5-kinase
MHARKKWIAFASLSQGSILIDKGAETALVAKGKSLLPSGVLEVRGDFERGMVVAVLSAGSEREIARGMVNYSSQELQLVAGKKSSEIAKILGEKDYDEAIHRNNLWVEN